MLLADTLAQLPPLWQAGHGVSGERPVEHRILLRSDSAGESRRLAEEYVELNIEFSLGYQIDGRVRDGVACVPTRCWHPAVEADGQRRDDAEVVEFTTLVNLDAWLAGTRLILRRERPHQGAQLSLFDTIEGMRHTAFITNQSSVDFAALELQQRQRARAENAIRDAKAAGLSNLPFDDIVNNDVWMQLCFAANDLLAWAQRVGCTGQLRRATPKTIRHRLLYRLHLDRHWPWTHALLDAIHRVRTAVTSP